PRKFVHALDEMVQRSVAVWLCARSGRMVTAHEPRTCLVAELMTSKVRVDGSVAAPPPPTFLIWAESVHGVPQRLFSTESTEYSGGQLAGSSRSTALVGALMAKSLL